VKNIWNILGIGLRENKMTSKYAIDSDTLAEYWLKVITCKLFHKKYMWHSFDGWFMIYGCDKCKREWC